MGYIEQASLLRRVEIVESLREILNQVKTIMSWAYASLKRFGDAIFVILLLPHIFICEIETFLCRQLEDGSVKLTKLSVYATLFLVFRPTIFFVHL